MKGLSGAERRLRGKEANVKEMAGDNKKYLKIKRAMIQARCRGISTGVYRRSMDAQWAAYAGVEMCYG